MLSRLTTLLLLNDACLVLVLCLSVVSTDERAISDAFGLSDVSSSVRLTYESHVDQLYLCILVVCAQTQMLDQLKFLCLENKLVFGVVETHRALFTMCRQHAQSQRALPSTLIFFFAFLRERRGTVVNYLRSALGVRRTGTGSFSSALPCRAETWRSAQLCCNELFFCGWAMRDVTARRRIRCGMNSVHLVNALDAFLFTQSRSHTKKYCLFLSPVLRLSVDLMHVGCCQIAIALVTVSSVRTYILFIAFITSSY